MKLIKKREVLDCIAKSNTTLYSDIKLGIFTPPVVIGENSVAWPLHECNAINAARMAGKNNDEIRQLVWTSPNIVDIFQCPVCCNSN